MKKRKLSMGIMMISLLLVSCGHNNKTVFNGEISGTNDLEQTQAYFLEGMHEVAKCPTGYYYMEETQTTTADLLKYYDDAAGESIVLCNKPQCEHDSKECMAYIDMSEYKPRLYYYNSSLYMIRMNGDMERISTDGTERTVLGNICNSGSSDTVYVSFNGNTAYVSREIEEVSGDVIAEIFAFNLETGNSSKVFSETAHGLGIASLRTYAGSTYFVKIEISRDDNDIYSVVSDGLYRIEGDNVQLVMNDNIYEFCIDSEQSNLYYSKLDDSGIYVYNTGSGEKRKIYDNESGNSFTITYDGEYIWMDDTQYKSMSRYVNKQMEELNYTIYQLSKDGELIAKRVVPDSEKIFAILHGDKTKMFMFSLNKDSIIYIDKENIEHGEIKELK